MDTLHRRELFRLFGALGVMSILGEKLTSGENVMSQIDHLLIGMRDLDQGMAWIENITGLKPMIGGSHPGGGTRNALLALGRHRYLELIAPDPAQPAFHFHIDIRKLPSPRLVTWAAASSNIDATAKIAQQAGYEIFGPSDGSRARPDGKVLKWKTLGVLTKFGHNGIEPFPFFIQWGADTLHPSQDSPKGCALESFTIEHPDAKLLRAVLEKFGLEVKTKKSENARLIAVP